MSWEVIENLKPEKQTAAIPPNGIYVCNRGLNVRRGGADRGEVRYIKLSIGAELARKLLLRADTVGVQLLFGLGEENGKIKVSVDATNGNFIAKRNAKGNYSVTINKASAEGLFSLNFPAFCIDTVEALHPQNGQPPHCVFCASDAMLEAEG